MEWEGLLSDPGTGHSFQEPGRQKQAWRGAESAGSLGLLGQASWVIWNRGQEHGLWSQTEHLVFPGS